MWTSVPTLCLGYSQSVAQGKQLESMKQTHKSSKDVEACLVRKMLESLPPGCQASGGKFDKRFEKLPNSK